MNRLMTLTSVLVVALGAHTAVVAQPGRGNDDDRGRGEQGPPGKGRGGDDDRGRGRDRDRDDDRGPARAVARQIERERTDMRREVRQAERDWDRRVESERERMEDRRRDATIAAVASAVGVPGAVLLREPDRGLIAGCPPGLAKRDNGCLPPGQARQLARSRYDAYWGRYDDRYDYRYSDGYVYRLSPQGSLLGYLPVLGGALGLGNIWPQRYSYQAPPQYQMDYYRLNDRYNYRYADGVLYGVDPQTQAIGQVAALLTGQSWNVGQAMPAGYDVYNVPYDYRDRYRDTPDAWYRYNDGYVYQVDPTTRLVQTVIQLLT